MHAEAFVFIIMQTVKCRPLHELNTHNGVVIGVLCFELDVSGTSAEICLHILHNCCPLLFKSGHTSQVDERSDVHAANTGKKSNLCRRGISSYISRLTRECNNLTTL
jgi:hypothetical protein